MTLTPHISQVLCSFINNLPFTLSSTLTFQMLLQC